MKITALAGGVGGAKLSYGLAKLLNPEELSIVVNTGDDFEHFGLYISPDVDTVCYTLAGIANPSTGWGIKGDTFHTIEALTRLGAPNWFQLGDVDLATHLERTRLLNQGTTLTKTTQQICKNLGVDHPVLPMTDDRVSTWVETKELGFLPFQEYFVKHRFDPKCKSFLFKGIDKAKPGIQVLESLDESDAVVICPSNPFVSIDPILSLKGIREIIEHKFVVCVSPIIGGNAVKGPLAKMFIELGHKPSPQVVIDHYQGLLDCIFLDPEDEKEILPETRSSIIIHATDILLPEEASRVRLAKEILDLIKNHL
ncbi:MAG: 2-phospho-L-lactate transferase [Chloroflexi bacterium]|nr:2-phospho-L-lactate transferase [Chloroflexota bacterium]